MREVARAGPELLVRRGADARPARARGGTRRERERGAQPTPAAGPRQGGRGAAGGRKARASAYTLGSSYKLDLLRYGIYRYLRYRYHLRYLRYRR